jgi:hypothetical protein
VLLHCGGMLTMISVPIVIRVILVIVGTTVPPLPEPHEVFPRERKPGGGGTRLGQA